MILVITKHLKSYLKAWITKKITIDEAEREKDEFNAIIGVSEDYTPRNNKYIEAKNRLLNNGKTFYEEREKITEGCKDGIFPFNYAEVSEEQMRYKREEKKNN